MTRTVDLVKYLPQFMQDFKEIDETLEAENPEFVISWDAADRVLKNEFIATADEYGISRFEKLMSIKPAKTDSLETRRTRVQARWFNDMPYTYRVLLARLTAICGSYTVEQNFDCGYTLRVRLDYDRYLEVENELQNLFDTIIPCNIYAVPVRVTSDTALTYLPTCVSGIRQFMSATIHGDMRATTITAQLPTNISGTRQFISAKLPEFTTLATTDGDTLCTSDNEILIAEVRT